MAWLGGAAFVVSLAWCAWTYAITWGATRPHVSTAALAVDVLLFVAFATHHSVAARAAVKHALTQAVGERNVRTLYVWIASLLLILVCVAWRPIGGDFYAHRGALAVPHVVIQLAGGWMLIQAVRLLDPLELAGIRPGGSKPLQTHGPYNLVRHPIYLGWIAIAFGWPHMTGDRFVFATISSAYLLVAIPWEEKSLMKIFGCAYAEYARRVRWRVIPFVY